jgi:hypothetical protein
MGRKIFRSSSLTTPMQELRSDGAEPRLFPAGASRPIDSTNAWTLSAAGDEARGHRPAAAVRGVLPGTLLYLVLIGLVATVTVGTFFGVGVLLLATPAKQTIAAAGRTPAHPSAPISLETGIPHFAAASIPGPSFEQHPATDDALPLPHSGIAPLLMPTSAGSERPIKIVPAPTSSVPTAVPTGATIRPPPSWEHAAPYRPVGAPPTSDQRLDQTRTAWRHYQLRSARNDRSRGQRSSHFGQSLTQSQAGQTGSFDQLLTQLTGETKSAGETLTPPRAGEPDPFAPQASNR